MPETGPGIHVMSRPNLTGSAGLIAGGWFALAPQAWHGLGDAAAHLPAECGRNSIPGQI